MRRKMLKIEFLRKWRRGKFWTITFLGGGVSANFEHWNFEEVEGRQILHLNFEEAEGRQILNIEILRRWKGAKF